MTKEATNFGYMPILTKGTIKKVAYQDMGDQSAWGIGNDGRASWTAGSWKVGKDIFLTIEEARADADAQLKKKLASLRKQLEAAEKLDPKNFPIVD
jgi:hypothetical protein